jgi:hypothetical protein
VDRAEGEPTDRLEVVEAVGDLLPNPVLVRALVLDEQAAAGVSVLAPTQAGPRLLAGFSLSAGITELSRIRLKFPTPAATSAASKAASSVLPWPTALARWSFIAVLDGDRNVIGWITGRTTTRC